MLEVNVSLKYWGTVLQAQQTVSQPPSAAPLSVVCSTGAVLSGCAAHQCGTGPGRGTAL